MNESLRNRGITQTSLASNAAFVLEDAGLYLPTQHKVLQNQEGAFFCECLKLTYNGKIELVYMTSDYCPLSSLLPSVSAHHFFIILTELINCIKEIQDNGFLSCGNIQLAANQIFIDQSTYKVKLIYLPVLNFSTDNEFMGRFRIALNDIVSAVSCLHPEVVFRLRTDILNASAQLGELSRLVNLARQSGSGAGDNTDRLSSLTPQSPGTDAAAVPTPGSRLVMESLYKGICIMFRITQDEFTIGKKSDLVDGAILGNPAVSRRHCAIIRKDGVFFISDLGSANGTFVNQKMLPEKTPHPLRTGDIVRIADIDFKVTIEEAI